MRRVLTLVALAAACGRFDADDVPPTADGGTAKEAGSSSGASSSSGAPPIALCSTLHAPGCGGTVQLLDFTGKAIVTEGTVLTTFDGGTSEPCGVVHTTCVPGANLKRAYYTYDLPLDERHFRVRHQGVGPVTSGTEGTTLAGGAIVPLTFGCGFYFTLDVGAEMEVRLEVSQRTFEIDGANSDSTVANHDPKGVPFLDGGPDKTTPRDWTIDLTIQPPNVVADGMISPIVLVAGPDGVTVTGRPVAFKGTITKAELRCGLLQVAPEQVDPCDLTMRQMELEVCNP